MAKHLSKNQVSDLLSTLETRFKNNPERHPGLKWKNVLQRLEGSPDKLWSINEMEKTGGEPDVVSVDKKTGEFIFFDCSEESPKGRRSLCYDDEALKARKQHKPKSSALQMASQMKIDVLSEEQYRSLQQLGAFDSKTSSWIKTPANIRKLGGALFGDFRFDHVFIYHNGAQSYYAARGFRGSLRV